MSISSVVSRGLTATAVGLLVFAAAGAEAQQQQPGQTTYYGQAGQQPGQIRQQLGQQAQQRFGQGGQWQQQPQQQFGQTGQWGQQQQPQQQFGQGQWSQQQQQAQVGQGQIGRQGIKRLQQALQQAGFQNVQEVQIIDGAHIVEGRTQDGQRIMMVMRPPLEQMMGQRVTVGQQRAQAGQQPGQQQRQQFGQMGEQAQQGQEGKEEQKQRQQLGQLGQQQGDKKEE